MKTRNVMLVIPELSMGGAQRSIAKLSHELAKYFTVYIVVFNNNHPTAYPFAGHLISLDVFPGKSWIEKTHAFCQRTLRLRNLKGRLNIDTCISFLEGADYINVLSKKKEKVILSIRGSKVHDITMHKKLFWLRSKILIPFVYKKAHLIVTVNHGIKAELTREFGLPKDKIKTIGNFYNAVEINRLSLAPRGDLEILYNKMVLVTTGRLSPEKGLRELVKVFARLHRRMKGTRLLIVGDGPVFEELILLCYKEKLLISCGLHNLASADVIFTGQQENVFMFLRGASLYLMNSASEGFPNGLVEAIICGVPVISSDCPYGPREILAPNLTGIQPVKHPFEADCGVLMPPAEDDASLDLWVQTIANILSNEDFRKKLAQATKQKAQSFGKEKIIPHWLKIIE